MRRLSPAARMVVAVAAIALLFDAAVVALPALADNGAAASPAAGMLAVESTAEPWTVAPATMPVYDPTENPTATPVPTPTPKPTPRPTPRDTVVNARAWVKSAIGIKQYNCIDNIFTRESNWNPLLVNRKSGAYGIPQALPGSKMAIMGSNWRTSPLTQVKWGVYYVNQRYGSACGAWAFWQSHGWY